MFVFPCSCREHRALRLLKTPICADVQRTENQEYEITAAHRAQPGRLAEPSPSTAPTLRHGCLVRRIAEPQIARGTSVSSWYDAASNGANSDSDGLPGRPPLVGP